MPSRKVTQYDQPSIREPSEEVPLRELRDGKLAKLLRDMLETMRKEHGVGIAAPQIFVNRRVIIVDTNDGPKFIINPILSKKSLKRETIEEGCLSVKGVFGQVKRHYAVHVEGYNELGEPVEYKPKGFLARIFQHEVDHLNGTLFIDRASLITQGSIDLKQWRRSV
jgi:peptide deformylase